MTDWSTVVCPFCRAMPGERCSTIGRAISRKTTPHMARMKRAAALSGPYAPPGDESAYDKPPAKKRKHKKRKHKKRA